MGYSAHYTTRCQQRGMPQIFEDLIKAYGSYYKRPGGAEGVLFDGQAVDRATKHLKKILQHIPKLKGRMDIVADNGETMTTYIRNKKRVRLNKKQRVKKR